MCFGGSIEGRIRQGRQRDVLGRVRCLGHRESARGGGHRRVVVRRVGWQEGDAERVGADRQDCSDRG